jgi:hypothetical protein
MSLMVGSKLIQAALNSSLGSAYGQGKALGVNCLMPFANLLAYAIVRCRRGLLRSAAGRA